MRINAVTLCIAVGLAAASWTPAVHAKEPPRAHTRPAQSGGSMAIDERLFENVPLNTRESTPCSPKDPGPNWRGILIQAPKQVVISRGQEAKTAYAGIPVCGLYTLDLASLMDGAPMMLILKDQATQAIYTGAVVDKDPSPEEPPPPEKPLDPEALKGLATSSYFNPNIASYVRLPARPATYQVMVKYGGMQSNIVTIQILVGQ